jgi:hypothetical protein
MFIIYDICDKYKLAIKIGKKEQVFSLCNNK